MAMMETISQLIALCRPEALGSIGVPGSLLLAGLAGVSYVRTVRAGPGHRRLALAPYATLFCWWMIKTAYDEIEQAERPPRQE